MCCSFPEEEPQGEEQLCRSSFHQPEWESRGYREIPLKSPVREGYYGLEWRDFPGISLGRLVFWLQALEKFGKIGKKKSQVYKSVGPDEVHPCVLKEQLDEVAKPLSAISQKLWKSGEVPTDWKRRNTTPIFEKGKKEDPGNDRPVSLTSVPSKLTEQILRETMLRHRWLVAASTASLRAKRAWQIWWPSTMGLQHWWIREDLSSTWTCAKHLTLSRTTSLSTNWRDMDLTDGPLGGKGIGWMGTLKDLWSTAQCSSGHQWQVALLRGWYWDQWC